MRWLNNPSMIKIQEKLISTELFKEEFACNLMACKGACCIEGDAGAPLEAEECEILDEIYPQVAPYLSEQSQKAIEEQGKWVKEPDGELETPLVKGKECAYVIFENDIAFCGIEKAWREGKIEWQKPISCHLYPIRVTKMLRVGMEALNYDRWSICNPACAEGKKLGLPVFRFLKAPLTRRYGESFYQELEEVYAAMVDQ